MSDEKRRLAFQMMIRDANKMMRQMGNEGRFTQDDIVRHCEQVVETYERKKSEDKPPKKDKDK